MSQKMKIRVFLCISILCWGVIACWAMYTHQQGSAVDPILDTIHGNVYSSPQSFAIYPGEPQREISPVGGVIANPLNNPGSTGETMTMLRQNLNSDILVVVAFGEDMGPAPLTGDWGWQGSYGVVQTEKDTVEALINAGMAGNNRALDTVSDLGMVMDYISYYLPGVVVVPIALDSDSPLSEIESALSQYRHILSQYPAVVVTPHGGESNLSQYAFTESTLTLDQVEELTFAGVLPPEASMALCALNTLVPPDSVISVFPGTDFSTGEPVAKSTYFSDFQIIYEK